MTTFHITYRYELLTRDERSLGDLEGVVKGSGQHSESAQSSVHTSAQVSIRDTGQVEDWAQVRVKPWVTVNGVEWPLGVFVPAIPSWEYTPDGFRVADVTLADKTILLERDYFGLAASGVER
ncbi:MAG TPA: hypothetical protein VK054_01745, partial [Beutenbergiaceae bacterium]|nr:hypothetical protein [Beutenbergiaceae bacterium]